ncbi:putative G-type lectin S-receptor-like serine/threonine-protein kinase At1g61610 [Typha latifolia]|uniref:putative G-type lectin S-receptor-like serine/threonine-protein kinase At1g61610 n=1 Tax=Typha latifolia TaxID=4733 RepID=UPI003C2C7C4D
MASISLTSLAFSFLLSLSIAQTLPSSLIQELNQPPPPDFPLTVSDLCKLHPSLRYCNAIKTDLANIFKSFVVARHLCVESKNADCNANFARIDLRSRPKAAPLYLSFAFFWKYCPLSILSVDVSNNSLNGVFPYDILQCTQIEFLDLSFNELVGDLSLDAFNNLTNLSVLNLSYNGFSEVNLKKVAFFDRFNESSFINSGLRSQDHHHGLKIMTTIILLAGVLVSVVLLVGFLVWALPKKDYKFSIASLKKATHKFSTDNLIWKEEKEEMYTGRLSDGVEVVIRMQKGRFSKESIKAFDEECHVLMQLSHKNLVKIIGFCNQRGLKAIVLENLGVCNVKQWLTGSPPWKQRLKVAVGVAEGMRYAHEQSSHVGYDLSTEDIMLTEDIEPLISTWKIFDHKNRSKKVYNFGLLLLELVANRSPGEGFERGESGFLQWMRMQCQGHALRKVIDEKMALTATSYEQIKQMVEIGLACTDVSADHMTPTINDISRLLHKIYMTPPKSTHSHGALHEGNKVRSKGHIKEEFLNK